VTALFRILPGLPASGPWPVQFSQTGQGTHREGFVVEFSPVGKQTWVGNFQPGMTSYNSVLPNLDGKSFIVIAGGQAYVVDPSERRLLGTFGGDVHAVLADPDLSVFVISNGVWLEAWERTGMRWRTRRISWDGISKLRIENETVKGEAWSPIDDRDYPFAVDLQTGAVEGGSYNGPPD
jgi:hypothetical protein